MEIYISPILTRAHFHITPMYSYSHYHHSPKRHKKWLLTTRSNHSHLRFKSTSAQVSIKSLDSAEVNRTPEFVEVIGIGSRKDVVFGFCSNSPFLSPKLRFWNLIIEDSIKMQLHQFNGKDVSPSVMEISSGWEPCFKAVILVATAAYAPDYIRVVDILKGVKSANGLAVGIIVKPFSFEGQRRQVEIKDLIKKLEEHTDFCIEIDTDVLLEKDFVTLDEALRTANTAVLMAMNAVSVLVSESKKKLLDSTQDNMEELDVSQIIKILEGYKQAEVGFGAGYNMKTSTMRAIHDCPFFSAGLKGLDGVVIGILASSDAIENSDIKIFLHNLRKTEFKGQIILSIVHEPNLEPNHIITTVIRVSRTRQQASQESSILSRLSQRFPFIFNLFRRHNSESRNTEEGNFSENPTVPVMDLQESLEMSDIIFSASEIEGFGNYSAEIQTILSNKEDRVYNSSVPESKEIGFSEPVPDYSSFCNSNTKGVTSYEREPLIRKFESVSNGQEDWDKDSGDTLLDKLSIFKLPVGVKPAAELNSSLYDYDSRDQQKEVDENIPAQQIRIAPRAFSNTPADTGFEAVSELYDSEFPVLKGTYDSISKREGVLASRAASMLEAERDSQKKWNPIMEMKYRGGLYKGRCQGGLPEGKGRLSLSDGSIYDGMWRYGKRSGLGTFYFSNGDFYQGSWRDDVMHGKGWLYFQTGDRWFANFWKGKANGEGRFYSKIGEIFFGHFKDGWRHGHFLCISVDGERYLEEWDEGVLSSKKKLDADVGT